MSNVIRFNLKDYQNTAESGCKSRNILSLRYSQSLCWLAPPPLFHIFNTVPMPTSTVKKSLQQLSEAQRDAIVAHALHFYVNFNYEGFLEDILHTYASMQEGDMPVREDLYEYADRVGELYKKVREFTAL